MSVPGRVTSMDQGWEAGVTPPMGSRVSWSRRKEGNEAGEVGGARPEWAELGASALGNYMSPNFPFSELEERSHF